MRRKHVKPPVPTGDAALRLERLSATSASTTWYDISATGNNGTASDAAIFADFNFDGIVDRVDLTSAGPESDFTQNFTFCFWYKRAIPGLQQSTMADTRSPAPAGSLGGWTYRDNAGGSYDDFWLSIYNPTYQFQNASPGSDGDWHFAAVTFTSGVGWKAYADGALYRTQNNPAINGTGEAMRIGTGAYNKFEGYIDTVRVYPRLLSADEILRDYHAGKAAHP